MDLPKNLLGFPVEEEGQLSLKGFPVFFSTQYEVKTGKIVSVDCLFVSPRNDTQLIPLMKTVARLQADLYRPCVVVAPLSSYQVRRLTEEGVAWVVSAERFFLPFLGLSLASGQGERRRPSAYLTPQAQRLVGHIIDRSWAGKSTSEVADLLGKSLPSVSNYFAEIARIAPEVFDSRGRARLVAELSPRQVREAWRALEPFLPSPCRRRAYLKAAEGVDVWFDRGLAQAGLTALSATTMVGDDPWRTYAVSSFQELDALMTATDAQEVEEGDGPDALIEVWSYPPEAPNGFVRDLPLYLSLRDRGGEDPRLDDALEELAERIGL